MTNELAVLFLFGTPCLAIIGGIAAAILKTRGQQRLMDLAQRERIAAIERGLDLAQLPPYPAAAVSPRAAALRRAQGLTIGGVLSLAIGIGLSLTMLLLPEHDGREAWPIGFVPVCVGLALLICARVVRRGADEL
jgi:hypothetical protein